MSSEDKRIVILEFDNSKFDKNVEKSNETLKKLKENLKLDGASKGLDSISSTAKRFDISHIGQSIGTVTTKFSALEIIGKRVLENLTDSAMRFGSNLVNSIVEPIKSGGWRRAMNLEQANFQLEGLLGGSADGAEKIAAIMESVNQSVKGTAYGLDQAAKVASQFVATGIEDADQMLSYLKGVAGAAAMTGRNYDDIGRIFTTVAGQGRLMGDQLLQFASSGLNVAATLSKQMNITEAEFRDMVSKGEISFDQFASGMAEAFGEHATKANETYTGSLSNMRAALARIGAEVATPALTNFRDIFNSLRPIIDNVHEALKPFINTLNFDFSTATKNTVKTLGWLNDKLKGFLGDTKKTAEETEEVAESAAKAAEEIEKVAREVISGKYGSGEERRAQLEALGYSYEEVQNKVNELLGCDFRYEVQAKETTKTVKKQTSAFKDFKDKIDSVKEAQEKLDQDYRERASNNFFAGIRKMIVVVAQYGSVVRSAFSEVFSGSFSKHIYNLAYRFRKFTDTLKLNETQSEGVKRIFTGIFSVLKFGLNIVGNIAGAFGRLLGYFGDLVKRGLEFVGSVTDIEDATERLSKHFNGFETLRGIISKLSAQFEIFRQKFKETAAAVKESSGFKHLQETAENLWTAIKGIAKSFGESLLNKFQKFSETKLDFSWLDRITELVSSASDKVATFIDKLLAGETPINAFFSSFSGKATTWFKEFLELAGIAKDNIAEFFKNFKFSENFNNFVEKLQNMSLSDIGQSILDFINSLLESLTNIQEGNENSVITKIEEFFANVKEKFNKIQEDLANVDWEYIKQEAQKVIQTILALGAIFLMASVLMSGVKFFNSLANLANSASGALDVISGRKTAMDKIPGIIDSVTKMVAVIAGSLAILSLINDEKRTRAVEDLLTLIGVIAGALTIIGGIKLINGKKIAQIGGAFQSIGTGVAALVASVVVLSFMNWKKALKGIGFVGMLLLEMTAAMKLAGNASLSGSPAAFLALAVAIDLLVPAIWALGTMDVDKAGQGLFFITILVSELAGAALLAGQVKAAAAFMGLAIAVDLLVPAILILGITPWEVALKGVGTISAIVLALGGAARLAKSVNPWVFVAMAIPLATAIAGLYVLSGLEKWNLIAAAVALGGVMLALGAAAKNVDNGGIKGVGMMVLLCVPLGVVAYSLYELAQCPWRNILTSAFSLAKVFSAVSKAIVVLSGVDFWAGIKAIGLLDILIVSLVGTLAVIGGLFGDGGLLGHAWLDKAESAMGSIGRAIGSLVGGLIDASGFGNFSASKMITDLGTAIGSFGESIGPFVDSVSKISDNTASKLGTLASALLEISAAELLDQLTQLLGGEGTLVRFGDQLAAFGTKIGEFTTNATGEGLDSAVAAVEKCAGLWPMLKEKGLGGNVASQWWNGNPLDVLGKGLASFSEALQGIKTVNITALNNINAAATPAVSAYKTLKAGGFLMGNFLVKALAGDPLKVLGERLMSFSNSVQGLKTVSITALNNLAAAATPAVNAYKTLKSGGFMMGNFAVKFLAGDPLGTLGERLRSFSDSVQGIKTVSITAMNNLKEAAVPAVEAYQTVTGSGIKAHLFSMFTQGDPMERLGTQLKNFADNVQHIKSVDSAAISSVATAITDAAPSFSAVIDAGIHGGAQGWWEGKPMENLGNQLKAFAEAMQGMPTDVDTDTLTKINDLMPEAIRIVRNASRVGENDANGFHIETFFETLELISTKLSVFGLKASFILTGKIRSVTNVIPKLIEMTTAMSNATTSGVEAYSDTLVSVGEKLKSFNDSVANISTTNISAVSSSVAQIASMQKQLQSSTNTMGAGLSSSMSSATTSAMNAMTNTMKAGAASISAITSNIASQATKSLSGLTTSFGKIASDASSALARGLGAGQSAVSSNATALKNKANQAVSSLPANMSSYGSSAGNSFAAGIGSKAGVVSSNATNLKNKAVSAVSSAAGAMSGHGQNAGQSFANGIGAKSGDAYNNAHNLAKRGESGARDGSGGFYGVGVNAGQGMINGMRAKSGELYNLAHSMGTSAAAAARNALRIQSPSKVFYEIGDFAVQGFINALADGNRATRLAGEKLVKIAVTGAENSLDFFQNVIDDNLDLVPTITPVLDLSNIQRGSGLIGNMLGGNRLTLSGATIKGLESIAVGGYVNDNGDVVNAINGLKDGMGNTTFNITVDGSTSPEEFVDDLVRILKNRSRF